ncbi:hypothetical protein GGX14DRAFT_595407 [Mycena pura]|uniref:Uncharacterized protein n=1 Tax=Mycena pura TaxID=153505 RepID=A0AAD6YFK6_9AGAR|nr:hypothetical protein GGX14DRAFT_595407 [Mycena pura]
MTHFPRHAFLLVHTACCSTVHALLLPHCLLHALPVTHYSPHSSTLHAWLTCALRWQPLIASLHAVYLRLAAPPCMHSHPCTRKSVRPVRRVCAPHMLYACARPPHIPARAPRRSPYACAIMQVPRVVHLRAIHARSVCCARACSPPHLGACAALLPAATRAPPPRTHALAGAVCMAGLALHYYPPPHAVHARRVVPPTRMLNPVRRTYPMLLPTARFAARHMCAPRRCARRTCVMHARHTVRAVHSGYPSPLALLHVVHVHPAAVTLAGPGCSARRARRSMRCAAARRSPSCTSYACPAAHPAAAVYFTCTRRVNACCLPPCTVHACRSAHTSAHTLPRVRARLTSGAPCTDFRCTPRRTPHDTPPHAPPHADAPPHALLQITTDHHCPLLGVPSALLAIYRPPRLPFRHATSKSGQLLVLSFIAPAVTPSLRACARTQHPKCMTPPTLRIPDATHAHTPHCAPPATRLSLRHTPHLMPCMHSLLHYAPPPLPRAAHTPIVHLCRCARSMPPRRTSHLTMCARPLHMQYTPAAANA